MTVNIILEVPWNCMSGEGVGRGFGVSLVINFGSESVGRRTRWRRRVRVTSPSRGWLLRRWRTRPSTLLRGSRASSRRTAVWWSTSRWSWPSSAWRRSTSNLTAWGWATPSTATKSPSRWRILASSKTSCRNKVFTKLRDSQQGYHQSLWNNFEKIWCHCSYPVKKHDLFCQEVV